MSGKQKVLLGITLGALLLCSAGALYGYFELWPRVTGHLSDALENEIATTVERTAGYALALDSSDDGTVRVAASDLDFSTVHDDTGESGYDITNNDVTIYNAFVEIRPDGLHVYLSDMELHGMVLESSTVSSSCTMSRRKAVSPGSFSKRMCWKAV